MCYVGVAFFTLNNPESEILEYILNSSGLWGDISLQTYSVTGGREQEKLRRHYSIIKLRRHYSIIKLRRHYSIITCYISLCLAAFVRARLHCCWSNSNWNQISVTKVKSFNHIFYYHGLNWDMCPEIYSHCCLVWTKLLLRGTPCR